MTFSANFSFNLFTSNISVPTHFVIYIAFVIKSLHFVITVAFAHEKPVALCIKLLSHFVIT